MKQVGALKNDKASARRYILMASSHKIFWRTREYFRPLNSQLSLITQPECTLHITRTYYTRYLHLPILSILFVTELTRVRVGTGFFVRNSHVCLGLRLDFNFTIKHAPRSAMLQHHFIVASIILACLRFSGLASSTQITYTIN